MWSLNLRASKVLIVKKEKESIELTNTFLSLRH